MTFSPAARSGVRRAVVAMLVVPAVLFGLLVMTVFAGGGGAALAVVAGVLLVGAGVVALAGHGPTRRRARETVVVLAALLSGLAGFVGSVFVGIGVGALGFMGSAGWAEEGWFLLSSVLGVASAGVCWWLVRRELVAAS